MIEVNIKRNRCNAVYSGRKLSSFWKKLLSVRPEDERSSFVRKGENHLADFRALGPASLFFVISLAVQVCAT